MVADSEVLAYAKVRTATTPSAALRLALARAGHLARTAARRPNLRSSVVAGSRRRGAQRPPGYARARLVSLMDRWVSWRPLPGDH